MRRIVVVGNSGSGKTTLAQELAAALGLPVLELDSVMHMPGWEPRPNDEFRGVIDEFSSSEEWVIDGNYVSEGTAEPAWPRADTFVWMDPPRVRNTLRVVWRTFRRGVARQELWNGNREELRNIVKRDPEENIVLWAWTRHAHYRERYEEAMDSSWAHADVHRLRNHAEVAGFLASVRR